MSIILGYSYANLQVIDVNGREATLSVNFPLTNLNGRQIETYEPEVSEVVTTNLEILPENIIRQRNQTLLGWWITWNFNYPEFIEGSDLKNFHTIFQKMLSRSNKNYRFVLTPRIDEGWRFFDVLYQPTSFSLGIPTGGSAAAFNKDFVISLKTKSFVTDLKWEIAAGQTSSIIVQHIQTWVTRE